MRSANQGWRVLHTWGVSSRSTASGWVVMSAMSWMVFFTSTSRARGAVAARDAISWATVSNWSSSTQRCTRPTRSASAPSITSPNTTPANVACGPAMRRSIQVWPPPGWMPICRKRVSNLALRAAMRTSQPSARFMPAPTAAPFTAASVGSGLRAMRRKPS